MKYFFLVFFVFVGSSVFSQKDSILQVKIKDSSFVLNKKLGNYPNIDDVQNEEQGITIANYKIISHVRDTTFLDTTLTIKKEYKYNYLRKDNFELMRFTNIGQTYNKLGVNFDGVNFYPKIGAEAKHFNYLEVEDMRYYNVATPLTELMFKTTFEQGQLLDALLTFNTSKQFNFSIGYKGFRSLGKYGSNQMESGNFTVTSNYVSENNKYQFRGHIAAQNIGGQENGGLSNKEAHFEAGDPDYSKRIRVDVNFSNTDNNILGKRYYMDHQYRLIGEQKDSISEQATTLTVGHMFNYETKFYQFTQRNNVSAFGDVFLSPINDKAILKTMHNQVNVEFNNKTLGKLKGRIDVYDYNYYFNSTLITNEGQIQSQLRGSEFLIGADYAKQIGRFKVNGDFTQNLSGDITGTLLNASAQYIINDSNKINVAIHSSAKMPNYNYLLYQSEYINYNWQNTANFEKEKVSNLRVNYTSKLLGNINAKYSTINNYTYFGSIASEEQIELGNEKVFVKPIQEVDAINYLKVKYNKEFRVGKFALDNTVMYQNVNQTNQVLNVPEIVTRNSLYYSSHVFKKAMYIQTGVIFKYFTSYNMDAYNPLLGEFYIQNNEKLGGYPMLDFFINAKIRQTRVFLKAEHFNSSFSGYNYYAAPDYPYSDFVIRFGLVWNFFS